MRKAKLLSLLLALAMVATVLVPATARAAGKVVTVGTQAELEEALKDPEVTKIAIKAKKGKTLNIPEGNYEGVSLVVEAKNVKLNNYGTFKVVKIRDAKKYMEHANGNTVKVTDNKLTIGVEKGAAVDALYLSKANANIKTVVRGDVEKLTASESVNLDLGVHGTLDALNLKKQSSVNVYGSTTVKITVNTGINSVAVTITASVPVDVQAKDNVDITVSAGAEDSKVTAVTEDAEIVLENETTEIVTIVSADGNEVKIESNVTVDTSEESADNSEETSDTDNEDDESEGSSSTGSSGATGGVSGGGVSGESGASSGGTAGGGTSSGGISGGGATGDMVTPSGDVTAPVIAQPEEDTVLLTLDENFANWEAPMLTATDDTDASVVVTATYFSSDTGANVTDLASAKAWMSKKHSRKITVMYTAKDAAGNEAEPVMVTYSSRLGNPLLSESNDCTIGDLNAGAGVTVSVDKEDGPEDTMIYNHVNIFVSGNVEAGIPEELKAVVGVDGFRTDDAYPNYTVLRLNDILPVGSNIEITEINTALDLYEDKSGMTETPDATHGKWRQITTRNVTEENNDLVILLIPDGRAELVIRNLDTGSLYHYVVSNTLNIREELIPPVIQIPEEDTVLLTRDENFVNWEAPMLTATDNVDTSVVVTATYSSTDTGSNVTDLASAKAWMSGSYGRTITVTYTAKDAAGNEAEPVVVTYTSRYGSPLLSEATDCTVGNLSAGTGVTVTVCKEDDPEHPVYYNTASIRVSGAVESGIPEELKEKVGVEGFRTDNAYPNYTVIVLNDILPISSNVEVTQINTALDMYEDKTGITESPTSFHGKWKQVSTMTVTETNNDMEVLLIPDGDAELLIRNLETGSVHHYVVSNSLSIVDELMPIQKLQNELLSAASGATITCTEEITIADGELLIVPAGVTLIFSGEGKLNIENNGAVKIFGTLVGAKSERFAFSETLGTPYMTFPIILGDGGVWKDGENTYTSVYTGNTAASSGSIYRGEAGQDFWIIRNTLQIEGNVVFDSSKFLNGGGTIILNDIVYSTPGYLNLSSTSGAYMSEITSGNDRTIYLNGSVEARTSSEHLAVLGNVTGSAICITAELSLSDIAPSGTSIEVVEKNESLKYLENYDGAVDANGKCIKTHTLSETGSIVILLTANTPITITVTAEDGTVYTCQINSRLYIRSSEE